MALLQIAEPGQTAAPHAHRLAAGIDLGTTHSLVAPVRSGRAETLADAQGAPAGAPPVVTAPEPMAPPAMPPQPDPVITQSAKMALSRRSMRVVSGMRRKAWSHCASVGYRFGRGECAARASLALLLKYRTSVKLIRDLKPGCDANQ